MYLSACGVKCKECTMIENCGGTCHDCAGAPFFIKDFGADVCPIFDCAVNKKGFTTCGECAELPCQIFYEWKDPSMTEEAHVQSIKDRAAALKAN